MKIIEVPLADLTPDIHNPRTHYTGIPDLAASIQQYGLLQNLVVREQADCFVVLGGNRRLKALQLLEAEGKWSSLVPCMVVGGGGTFESLVENVCRSDVPIWQLGRRYLELCEAGYEKGEIAVRIHRSPGHVSQAIRIAENLSPKIVERLDRMAAGVLSNNQILRIAKFIDVESRTPDEAGQLAELDRLLGEEKRRQRSTNEKARLLTERQVVWRRYLKLRQGTSIPSHAMPYVSAMIRYLRGEDHKLKFR